MDITDAVAAQTAETDADVPTFSFPDDNEIMVKDLPQVSSMLSSN
jgi:hypothetical protein